MISSSNRLSNLLRPQSFPQQRKPNHFAGLCSTAEEAAEKVGIGAPAPEGAIDSLPLTVCLKAYPDSDLDFFRSL